MKDHPYPWKDEEPNPDAKPDLRNKRTRRKENNSRKSEALKE